MNAQIGKENAIYKIITSRLFIHHQYQHPIYGLQEHPDPSSQYTCKYRDNSHINQVHSTNYKGEMKSYGKHKPCSIDINTNELAMSPTILEMAKEDITRL